MPTIELREHRILIFAPQGRDADVVKAVIESDGMQGQTLAGASVFLEELARGAAAAIVSEEALSAALLGSLAQWLARQPSWSDFPFVVLLAKRAGSTKAKLKATLSALGNLVLLERPLSADTLATAAAAALRGRRRQYEAREVLSQREAVASELASLNANLEAKVDERTLALAQANDRLTKEVMERERAQQAAIQAQKLEALGRLTGGVAHDFNNVLNVVQGNLELLAMLSKDEAVKVRAKTAVAACKRGAKLTAQLLTFARNQSLDLRPLSATLLFADVAELARPALGASIELITCVDDDVDAVVADASQIEMALLNLVINARDAMEGKGRVILHASRSTPPDGKLPKGSYVRLAVSDDGSGMSAEVAAKVFEPFFTTKSVGKGTGLGLSQVYGMAQQSGGDVAIHSVVGKGTTVEIWLVSAASVDLKIQSASVDRAALQGLKVLVVEDDETVRAGVVDALLSFGCEVVQAGCGHDGLAALLRGRPDVLLTDYLMPEMTGAELAARARSLFPALPVLVATGYADMEAIEGVLGVEAVLRKPFQLAELGQAITRVARLSSLESSLKVPATFTAA